MKAENNIGLITGGIIGIGCITALGLGIITLPVAIGVGAVVAVGFGAKELINMREDKKAIDPNQARDEKAPQQGFKEVNQRRGPLNEAHYEGKRIGEEIALEHLSNPRTTTTNSQIIQKYQLEAKKQNLSPQETKDANYKLIVAQTAKELAIDFTTKNAEFSKSMLEAYKQDKYFKKNVAIIKKSEPYTINLKALRENTIAESAFDEVVKVIAEHKQRPSSDPQSPIVRWGEKVRAG